MDLANLNESELHSNVVATRRPAISTSRATTTTRPTATSAGSASTSTSGGTAVSLPTGSLGGGSGSGSSSSGSTTSTTSTTSRRPPILAGTASNVGRPPIGASIGTTPIPPTAPTPPVVIAMPPTNTGGGSGGSGGGGGNSGGSNGGSDDNGYQGGYEGSDEGVNDTNDTQDADQMNDQADAIDDGLDGNVNFDGLANMPKMAIKGADGSGDDWTSDWYNGSGGGYVTDEEIKQTGEVVGGLLKAQAAKKAAQAATGCVKPSLPEMFFNKGKWDAYRECLAANKKASAPAPTSGSNTPPPSPEPKHKKFLHTTAGKVTLGVAAVGAAAGIFFAIKKFRKK